MRMNKKISSHASNNYRCYREALLLITVVVFMFHIQRTPNDAKQHPLAVSGLGGCPGGGDGRGGAPPPPPNAAAPAGGTTSKGSNPHNVPTECLELHQIEPSGAFFKEKAGKRLLDLEVSGQKDIYILGGGPQEKALKFTMDSPHFQLMKETFPESEQTSDLVGFDIGSNKGVYAYFLSSLGFTVHAFEIDENNFKILQHGKLANSKEISDRVNVYPIGLSNKIGRVGAVSGATSFRGYLSTETSSDEGRILSVSADCFVHHTRPHLGNNNVFVKLDVEGFEIAVLQGARNSILRNNHVRALVIEVGPDRWSRANNTFEEGLHEMESMGASFQNSYVLLRGDSACPKSLAEGNLADNEPRSFHEGTSMYRVEPNEWKPLLAQMKKQDSDCNFWYSNK